MWLSLADRGAILSLRVTLLIPTLLSVLGEHVLEAASTLHASRAITEQPGVVTSWCDGEMLITSHLGKYSGCWDRPLLLHSRHEPVPSASQTHRQEWGFWAPGSEELVISEKTAEWGPWECRRG